MASSKLRLIINVTFTLLLIRLFKLAVLLIFRVFKRFIYINFVEFSFGVLSRRIYLYLQFMALFFAARAVHAKLLCYIIIFVSCIQTESNRSIKQFYTFFRNIRSRILYRIL